MSRASLIWRWLVLALLMAAGPARAMEISQVRSTASQISDFNAVPFAVQFTTSTGGAVSLEIYDTRDIRVRRVAGGGTLNAGEHQLSWDGRDESGELVPAGEYRYVLVGIAPAGEEGESTTVIYDLTDLTGGERIAVRGVEWNGAKQTLSYSVPAPALVSVRVGLGNGGPLMRTLVDWLPRPAGQSVEAWDGRDESGYINLAEHPKGETSVVAVTLSENAFIVGNPQVAGSFVSIQPDGRHVRPSSNPQRKLNARPWTQPAEVRSDVRLKLEIANGAQEQGVVPVVRGKVPFRLDIAEEDRQRAMNLRFEAAFFVDGLKVYENEIGFLPMTWYWDASNVNPGEHYITANLIGYAGNFGMRTIKVVVE